MNFDILSYFDERGILYSYQGKNVSKGWVGIQCCFCPDSSNHLGINLRSGAFSCLRCGETGSSVKLVMELEMASYGEAMDIIKRHSGEEIPEPKYKPVKKLYPTENIIPKEATKDFPEKYKNYLRERRYDPEYLIEKYDLYACTDGKYANRILIPIKENNRTVNFLCRDVSKKARLPYINAKLPVEYHSIKSLLYFPKLDREILKVSSHSLYNQPIVIVEGVFDVWRIGDGAAAIFGLKFSKEQVYKISRFKRVFILFDSEDFAKEQAHKLAYEVNAFTKAEVLELGAGDPDDLSFSDVIHLRKELGL